MERIQFCGAFCLFVLFYFYTYVTALALQPGDYEYTSQIILGKWKKIHHTMKTNISKYLLWSQCSHLNI